MDNLREYVQAQREAAAHTLEATRDDMLNRVQRTLTRAADAVRDERDRVVAQLAASASHAASAACRAGEQAVSDAFTAAVGAVAAETAPYRQRAGRFFQTGQVHPPPCLTPEWLSVGVDRDPIHHDPHPILLSVPLCDSRRPVAHSETC